MVYRWIHKSWKFFWGILLSLLLVVAIVAGSIIGILQLDYTRNYISNQIEQQFENQYYADLTIGELDGFLPFRLSLHDVVLENTADSATTDTVLAVKRLDSQVDIWGLLQNKVTVTGFTAREPQVWLRSDEQGRKPLLVRRSEPIADSTSSGNAWFKQIEVVAPSLEIMSGSVEFLSTPGAEKIGGLPHEFSINDINASLFVDWGEEQRYLDIESFAAEADNLAFENLFLSGQLYSDSRFLEFNSLYLSVDNTRFILNGEIDGVNMMERKVVDQMLAAHYNLSINSSRLDLEDLSDFLPNLPNTEAQYTMDLEASGTLDSLQVDYVSVGTGESQVTLSGLFKKLTNKEQFSYQASLNEVNLQRDDLQKVAPSLKALQYQALENISASGEASGSLDSLNVNVNVNGAFGSLDLVASSQLKEPFAYSGKLSGSEVNLSPLAPTSIDTSSLTFDANFKGRGIQKQSAISDVQSTFKSGQVNGIAFDTLSLDANLKNGLVNSIYEYSISKEHLRGSLSADLREGSQELAARGYGENIDLSRFLGKNTIASTGLNFEYNVQLQNIDPETIYGRANFDIRPSVINGDTVRAHQMYMDLNEPDAATREFRLTSSLFDASISGDFTPVDLIKQARYWSIFFRNKYYGEVLFDSSSTLTLPSSEIQNPLVLDGDISFRDLGLLQHYFSDFPNLTTDSEISFSANTDGQRLLLSAGLQADTLQYNKLAFSNSNMQMSASFRADQDLKEFSTIDLEASIASMKSPSVELDSMQMDLAVKRDSISFTQQIGSISDNARFNISLLSSLSDSSVSVTIRDFFLGNNLYAWTEETYPSFTYFENGDISFHNFRFHNRNEFFGLQGTLSKNRTDSLTYILRDISLNRISDLVKGKIDFSGTVNGTLVTRSLTRQPTIQGALDVYEFRLNDRIIGDISFNSQFNPEQDRFNTQIDIVTDSTKYADYLESNDGIRQDIHLDGYFVRPESETVQDSLYYFDADFDQIDMWVIQLIIPNIFQQMEGQATGEGYITGNLEDFDFHADFQTENVYGKPEFVNSNLFISGPVQFDRDDGVVLDSVNVIDTKGGTGTVWGTIDLNDFSPITYLDLTLDMNSLQFLNNTMDPDVPFFGSVSGTGQVRLTGSNTDIYMRTVGSVRISEDSEISIPLLEETELSESGSFIRFVDSFEDYQKSQKADKSKEKQPLGEEELEVAIEQMTFSERFDLDLQFEAPQNVTVNLIFDPVTGEILTAEGTGQMRISMQDQDVQMFGRYNINGGNYQFVTGEIISRRLQLEPGGSIVWEGEPDNARLDISAVYNARPNISSLTSESTLEGQNQSSGQRVPIELIVEINGTLNSVENNYYFRLPSSMDISASSTLSYAINQINRNEQQKLLQATSIFITGQFIPTQGVSNTPASLSQSFTRGANVINPLLSNQVISPLLSNQINALLNSDVSRLDVDFNLNAYNEVDLGIALRLYNDRLILRREGQITGGTQNTLSERIGDINAIYRITRGLSVTAFHRQDQVLGSLGATGSGAGEVTPSVDGIGLESQVQYNSWNELMGRIKDFFNRLFGIKEND